MGAEQAPIGIFDSGVGGLTVFKEVARLLPGESILYLGDTARVPYGTKSAETVIRYARSCADILLGRGVKLLVVACNTASAFAVEELADSLPVPVVGVVEPGARAAVRQTRTGRVGVIGTHGTISSKAYVRVLQRLSPGIQVLDQACPLFVPLAEEGWTEGEVPLAIARAYLADLLKSGIDTLVLGCTHYPMLADTLAQVAGPGVSLVDSASETARVVEQMLDELRLGNPAPKADHRFLVTDAPAAFGRVARHFLGHELQEVEWVDF